MYERNSTVSGAAEPAPLTTVEGADATLLAALNTATGMIQSYCGRTFAKQEYTDVFRYLPDGSHYSVGRPLQLNARPVVSITSATVDTGTLDTTDYDLNKGAGQVRKLVCDAYSIWAGRKITIVYQAGYATIPDDLQGICLSLANALVASADVDPSIRRETVAGVYDVQYKDISPFTALGMTMSEIGTLDSYVAVAV